GRLRQQGAGRQDHPPAPPRAGHAARQHAGGAFGERARDAPLAGPAVAIRRHGPPRPHGAIPPARDVSQPGDGPRDAGAAFGPQRGPPGRSPTPSPRPTASAQDRGAALPGSRRASRGDGAAAPPGGRGQQARAAPRARGAARGGF
ncbi:unnamed protein product, partial [Prorocentrum cordatum]